jgi:hypothetical protein
VTEVIETSNRETYTEEQFDELKALLTEALNMLSRRHAAYFIWVSAASADHPGMAISACRTNLPSNAWEENKDKIIEQIREHQSEPAGLSAVASQLRALLEAVTKDAEEKDP